MKRLSAAGLLLVTAGVSAHPEVEDIAIIKQEKLVEASGLARSQLDAAILWAMNDGGSKPRVYAFDESGAHRGRLTLDPGRNRDWEEAYADARDADLPGSSPVYPYGTYARRRYGGVRVAAAPS